VLAPLDAAIFVLAIWLIVEAVAALRKGTGQGVQYDEKGSPIGQESEESGHR